MLSHLINSSLIRERHLAIVITPDLVLDDLLVGEFNLVVDSIITGYRILEVDLTTKEWKVLIGPAIVGAAGAAKPMGEAAQEPSDG